MIKIVENLVINSTDHYNNTSALNSTKNNSYFTYNNTEVNYNSSDTDNYNVTKIVDIDDLDLKSKGDFLREFLLCSENFGEIQFSISSRQILVLKICIYLSITCLLLNLLVYSLVPRLRNVPGKSLMSLSVAKICANVCFLCSQFVYQRQFQYRLCKVIAIFRHYFILTVFVWTVVIAYDCYNTFRSSKSLVNLNTLRNNSFLKYSLFCWTIPAIFIGSLIVIDLTVEQSIFKPNYGLHVCSIGSCEALLMYGVGPIGAILVVNVVYFVLVLHRLYSTGTETEIANRASLRAQCVWYTKLALILGLTWILSLIAIFTPISHIFFYTHAFSSLQGVIIFLAFTCRANVYQLLVRRLHYLRDRRHRYWDNRRNTQSFSRNHSITNNNEGSVSFSPDRVTEY